MRGSNGLWCFLIASLSCAPEGDPPPTTTSTVAVTSSVATTTAPEPPPPPPDDGPKPTDYIRLVRVPEILNDPNGLIPATQELSARGWRGTRRVLRECPWAFEGDDPYLGLGAAQADAFAARAGELVREAEDELIPRFPLQNRRCGSTDWPEPTDGPGWCDVTNIRKERYEPFGALGDADTRRGVFWVHVDEMRAMGESANRCRQAMDDAGARGWDAITGWCTRMNELGWTSEDCPR